MSVRKTTSVIIVGGVHTPGSGSESAAIVTNVFAPLATDHPNIAARVNLTVFPDQTSPTFRTSIPCYETLKKANEAKAVMPFCYVTE